MHTSLIYLGRRGAGGIISLELARHLSPHIQTSITTSSFAEQKELWRAAQYPLLEVDTYQGVASAFNSLLFRRKIHHLAQKIALQNPDILLFPMFHPWNFFLQKHLSHIPSVVYVHDPQPHPDLTGWIYSKLEQQSIKQAQQCIVMSENLIPALVSRGVPKDKIDVVPLGPLNFKTPAKDKPRTSPRLLFIGRIMPYKGLEILLQSYRHIRKKHTCSLHIVGEGNLSPYKKNLDLLEDVKIINQWIPDTEIGRYFQQCDLLVLPYTSASQSGIIPIAATFGLPVIATRTGGLPEQIDHGLNGWLVPPNDVDALSAAIEEAITHPEEAQLRGKRLQKKYQTQFSWEKNALLLIKSLEKAHQAGGHA